MKTSFTDDTGLPLFSFEGKTKLLSLSQLPLLLPPTLAALLFLLLEAVEAMVSVASPSELFTLLHYPGDGRKECACITT